MGIRYRNICSFYDQLMKVQNYAYSYYLIGLFLFWVLLDYKDYTFLNILKVTAIWISVVYFQGRIMCM